MARPLRIEFPGAIYHVTSRGNARLPIFEDDEDRESFLALLGAVVERFNWLCHSYCLMGNHYHLLIETPDTHLSKGLRQLNGVYTQRFNRRHGRVGHVFQGRFKAILVERDSYLLELCRYIVLNPVRAKMVKRAGEYRWSSYRACAGSATPPAWLQTDWVLGQFGKRRWAAQKRYAAFVREGIGDASPWSQLRGQVLLGSETFAEKLRPLLAGEAEVQEVPRLQRLAHRPSLEGLIGAAEHRSKAQRDRAIREAHLKYRYTLAEIGRHVGAHYTTVSRIVSQTQK